MANDNETMIILSEVLCYIHTYLSKSTVSNIKRVVSNFYTADIILEAKRTLWNKITFIGTYQDRKSTNRRSATEANLDDIISALVKIDESGSDQIIFAAQDISNIPQHFPEDLNTFSILERLSCLENKCKTHEDVLSTHRLEIDQIKENASSFELGCSDDGTSRLNEQIKADNLNKKSDESNRNQSNVKRIISLLENSKLTTKNSVGKTRHYSDSALEKLNILKVGDSSKIVSKPNNLKFASDLDGDSSKLCNNIKCNSNKNSFSRPEFNPLQSHTRRNTSRTYERMLAGPRELMGRREAPFRMNSNHISKNFSSRTFSRRSRLSETSSDDFKDSVFNNKDIDIFIYRVDRGNREDIYDHLDFKGIDVRNISQLSHPNSRYKSFKATISSHQLLYVLSSSFWPRGIKAKEFVDRH